PAVTRVKSHPVLLHEVERRVANFRGKKGSRAVIELWADLVTDRPRLVALLRDAVESPVAEHDIVEAHRIMVDRVAAVVARDPRERPPEKKPDRREKKRAAAAAVRGMRVEKDDADLPEGVRRQASERDEDLGDDANVRGDVGVDGI